MYWGVLYPTLAVLPQMEARGYGRIVNVTSIGGRVSVPHLLPYSSAKFAAVGLSEGLGAELAAKGIYVTTVVPGLMRTGSYLNADFKGDQVNEFTWFSLGASLPLISMDAEKAARQVVLATRRRATTVTLSLPALLLERFHGLFPGATIQISRLAERLLLPDTERTTTEHMRGMTAQAHMPDTRRQVHRTLTQLGQQAAERFHQYDGGRGGRNPATDPEVGGLPRATKPPRYNAQE
jgi:NAD(P)-dependent dehydrogenase (short-subunit alcohol dehydrogenase family)